MKFQKSHLEVSNTKIFIRSTAPEKVKGVVVLVHGMGEHSGRYVDSVVPTLVDGSLAVVLYDQVGHGKSSGKRGHCSGYTLLIEILDTIVSRARTLYPQVPFFLYGHSMGGNLVLNYALRNKAGITGVIATSPFLRLAFKPPKWKLVLGKLMMRIAPSITLSSGLDSNAISRIQDEVEAYRRDPLVHDLVSPMFSFPVIEAGEWAITHAQQLHIDTLLCHGSGDMIIDQEGTKAFHEHSNSTDLRLFEGAYHELHHDSCREELLVCISGWLKERIV